MPRIRQAYRFEQSVVPLDSMLFKPLKDAVQRWDVEVTWPGAPLGPHFRLLYQLHDDRYVLVDYVQCRRVTVPGFWRDQVLWVSDQQPLAWLAAPEEAANYLKDGQYPLPEVLEAVARRLISKADEERQDQGRDLSFWAGRNCLPDRGSQQAHLVDVIAKLRNLVAQGIRFIQHLRELTRDSLEVNRQFGRKFWVSLYEQFPVDPNVWWGDARRIPPAHVGLVDLKWPPATNPLKTAVQELQTILDGPLACVSPARVVDNRDYPTEAEARAALTKLMELLPELEALIVGLQTQIDGFEKSQQARAEQQAVAAAVPEPSTEDFQLWKLWKIEGMTQTEAAEHYTRITRIPIDQGQVSKAAGRVKDWLAAGNKLPELEPLETDRIRIVDPKHLDLGQRIDGRANRQRNKKLPE